jgi:AraC family transcriptional regulator of adaptative response / DNA-3-methyladenine glycosylase II
MVLERDSCYRAVKSRDARFDGRFFTAVTTTGIYCRPVCPARTPLRKNVRFYACAAAAEEAGFRPCRRCRPETAPGTPSWLGTSATVSRAVRLIEAGALAEKSVGSLAGRLGLGERQLRRLFEEHLGASPQSLEASRRLRVARLLLDATSLPMIEVAHQCGFGSVRQFNASVRTGFGRTPSELRRGQRSRDQKRIAVRLAFRPPLDWLALLSFMSLRAVPGVEEVNGDRYRRAIRGAGGAGVLDVALDGSARALRLSVPTELTAELPELVRRVRRLFDLDADPLAIGACLKGSALLARSVRAHPGLRVPGSWDPFEMAVRAVLGQQISVRGATTLCGRLVQQLGEPLGLAGELAWAFPLPGRLARADLSKLGVPRSRAETLRALGRAAMDEPRLFEPGRSLEDILVRLQTVPGIGPWTAHYLAMRAFGEPDAFPSGDLGLRQAVGDVTPAKLEGLAEAWRPWRSYATLHLWTQHSEEAGFAGRRAEAAGRSIQSEDHHADRALAS